MVQSVKVGLTKQVSTSSTWYRPSSTKSFVFEDGRATSGAVPSIAVREELAC